jgi:hypothetical protein
MVAGGSEEVEAGGVTEHQRLFLVQALANYEFFKLVESSRLPRCHALYCLQMATEMLGKAYAWRSGPRRKTHRAFAGFLKSLSKNRHAQKQLGFDGQNESWFHIIRKSGPLAERIENLAPALCNDGPNPEYPWPSDNPTTTPAEYLFPIWRELQDTAEGRQFLKLVGNLFPAAEAYL